jgi:hypothetical protein
VLWSSEAAAPFLTIPTVCPHCACRLPLVAKGFATATLGLRSSIRNPKLRGAMTTFAASYTTYLIAGYALFFGLAFTILAPLAAILLFLSPGTLLQGLLLIPHWAFSLAHDQNLGAFDTLLADELRRLDPAYATGLEQGLAAPDVQARRRRLGFTGLVTHKLRSSWLFSRRSLMLSAVGMVPLLGPPVAAAGQALLVAESIGATLLQPWLDSRGWDAATRRAWWERNRWVIAGWALPFSLLNAIPVLGGLVLGVAQAAAAHLIYRTLAPPEDARSREQATGEVDKVRRLRRPVRLSLHRPSVAFT